MPSPPPFVFRRFGIANAAAKVGHVEIRRGPAGRARALRAATPNADGGVARARRAGVVMRGRTGAL